MVSYGVRVTPAPFLAHYSLLRFRPIRGLIVRITFDGSVSLAVPLRGSLGFQLLLFSVDLAKNVVHMVLPQQPVHIAYVLAGGLTFLALVTGDCLAFLVADF